MDSEELRNRTKRFAVAIVKMADDLPNNKAVDVIYRQLLQAATSVGANYRAACKARSKADFVSKITIVEEEADESAYWLEMLLETGLGKPEHLMPLRKEAIELTAIFTASGKTAKKNR